MEFALLSKYYGFSVTEIKALTVYQYRSYLENIIEIEKLFSGQTRDEGRETRDEEETEEELSVDELLQICRKNKVRIPG